MKTIIVTLECPDWVTPEDIRTELSNTLYFLDGDYTDAVISQCKTTNITEQ